MTGKKTLLLLATTAACFVPFAAGAQEQPLDTRAILERGYQNRPDLSYSSEVEVGAGYNTEDSFKLGEYTGLTDEGVFAVGNVDVLQRAPFDGESTQYWEVTGTDLGLDSRSVHLGYGHQGTFDVFFDYDQIPHNQIDDGRTPYRGAGDSVLTLPSGFVKGTTTGGMTTLQSDLQNVEIETERKDLGGGITWHLTRNWSVSGTYHHQFKDGTDTIAGLFGTNGGNPAAAILPEPVDYETDTANFTVAYTGMRSQLELAYEGSWFTNKNDSLTWDGAFTNAGWDDSNPDRGRLSLPPDNQAHRISLSGGYNLTDTTRLTGVFSYARMTQDESFLPYTINPDLSVPVALPRNSLDGEVNNILANVAVTARPMPKLELAARYRYNDRDNTTPQDVFLHTANDVGDQAANNTSDARVNLPYSSTQHLVDLNAAYRILPSTKVSIGYEFENKDRTFSVVETTRDHTFKGKVQSAPLDYLNGYVAYAHTIRDGSEYDGNRPYVDSHTATFIANNPDEFDNHPFIRKFFLTDRNTDDFKAGLSVMPSEQVTLGLSGGYRFNDYDDPIFGLDTSTMGHVTVDVGFSPREDVTAYAFFTHERNTYKQRGYGFSPFGASNALPVNPAGLWSIDTDDQVETLGGRVEWAAIPDMLDLAAEYTFSTASTGYSFSSGSPPVLPVPDIKSRIHSLGVSADYHFDTNMSLKFAYRYEAFNSEDFALDGVGPATIDQVLNLGESSPDYVAHIFAVSLKYKF